MEEGRRNRKRKGLDKNLRICGKEEMKTLFMLAELMFKKVVLMNELAYCSLSNFYLSLAENCLFYLRS